MNGWLTAVVVACAIVLGFWAALMVLTSLLPPGLARDLVSLLPDCVTTARRLRRHPDVPKRAKIAAGIAALWVISPIDLIPEFIPIIGPLDDIVVVALALRYAGRRVPRAVLLEAWPGNPDLLERLLGGSRGSTNRPT